MRSVYYPNSKLELIELIKRQRTFLVTASKTGTVIPYDLLDDWNLGPFDVVSLEKMPSQIKMDSDGESVWIEGAVTWEDLRDELKSFGRDVLVSPTEQTAQVLAGVATSCSGERSFAYGPFREHIKQVHFIDGRGQEHRLCSHLPIESLFKDSLVDPELLENYKARYEKNKLFKNAPFPRLEKQTDLMVGSEGQLGVVTSVLMKTMPRISSSYFAIKLSRWTESFDLHQEMFERLQNLRGKIISAEFLDFMAIENSGVKEFLNIETGDFLILEVRQDQLDYIVENFLSEVEELDLESIIELDEKKQFLLRSGVPRWIQEKNSREHIIKMGTDAQFRPCHFKEAFQLYYQLHSESPCDWTLFGHFGDLHLHFNFLASSETKKACSEKLEWFYENVKLLNGSPFTEHGVGLLKKKYIHNFLAKDQRLVLNQIKKHFDPLNLFSPFGHFGEAVE